MSQLLVLALWAGALSALWIGVDWGRELQRTAPEVFLGAAPLVGRNFRDGWDWRFGWGLIGAGSLAAVLLTAVATGWFDRVRLRTVVVAASLGAGAFAVLLALTDGADGVLYGASDDVEYLANVPDAPPVATLVRTFVERINDYTVHVRGHPPGFLAVLKALDGIGLGGAWPAALLSVAATVLLPAGVLVTVWAVAGPDWVRRAAPFLVVAPYALWMVTSADAVFAAIGAWGVALLALGLRQTGVRALGRGARRRAATGHVAVHDVRRSDLPADSTRRRDRRPVVATVRNHAGGPRRAGAVGAAIVVTSAWYLAGFWWFDGAAATRAEYWEGTAQFRIWNYFIVANLAVALIAVGAATLAGLTKLRSRTMWVLVGGSLLAIVAADLSQLSKAEVERIWLLFYPWIVIAAAALVDEVRLPRRIVVPRQRRVGGLGRRAGPEQRSSCRPPSSPSGDPNPAAADPPLAGRLSAADGCAGAGAGAGGRW